MSRFDYRNTENTSVVDPDHSSPIINYRKDAKRDQIYIYGGWRTGYW